jgi:hypothetical protein
MEKIILILFVILLALSEVRAQNWTEGFETSDSITLPTGWSVWNAANFPIDPFTNWTVRDTGRSLPGLASATSKSHSGIKAIGVSWWSSVDTTGLDTTNTSDAWLVSKRIYVWQSGALMSYWMALGGGSAPYLDSVQIWFSTVDSTPSNFSQYYETISGTGPYGTFTQNFIVLDDFVGQTVWVGFRYNMDCTVDGFFVHIDDVEVINPIGIEPISSEIPARFSLKQNYPNPFNPVTNIEFDIAKTSTVTLVLYNSLGQEVRTLINEQLKPGSYKYDFHAGDLPSGAYFYRLIAGDFVQTNKMILVK